MYNVTLTARNMEELRGLAAALANDGQRPVEKTLKDFGLQEIIEAIEGQGYEIIRPGTKEDAGPTDLDIQRGEDPEENKKHVAAAKANAKAHDKAKAKKLQDARDLVQGATETAGGDTAGDTAGDTKAAKPGAASKSKEDLKSEALNIIMANYNDPKGKAAANALLKEFGTKNFHLIPEENLGDFHTRTFEVFKAAGFSV